MSQCQAPSQLCFNIFRRTSLFNILIFLLLFTLNDCSIDPKTGKYPPFIKAAQQGDIKRAIELMKNGEYINQTTIGNQTALHVASAEGQNEMVIWLLKNGANPLAEDLNSKTPADFAKKQGKIDIEKIILDYIKEFNIFIEENRINLVEIIEKEIYRIHLLFNQGNYTEIIRNAYPEFSRRQSKENLEQIFQSTKNEFGVFNSIMKKWINPITGSDIRAIYNSSYDKSNATELFMFVKYNGSYKLFQYRIFEGLKSPKDGDIFEK